MQWEGMNWIDLEKWWDVLSTLMNLGFHKMQGISWLRNCQPVNMDCAMEFVLKR
jgi:hypothetical protein